MSAGVVFSVCYCVWLRMYDLQVNAADYAPIMASSAGVPGNRTEFVKWLWSVGVWSYPDILHVSWVIV